MHACLGCFFHSTRIRLIVPLFLILDTISSSNVHIAAILLFTYPSKHAPACVHWITSLNKWWLQVRTGITALVLRMSMWETIRSLSIASHLFSSHVTSMLQFHCVICLGYIYTTRRCVQTCWYKVYITSCNTPQWNSYICTCGLGDFHWTGLIADNTTGIHTVATVNLEQESAAGCNCLQYWLYT